MDGSFFAYQVAREGEVFQGRIVKLPFSPLQPGNVLSKSTILRLTTRMPFPLRGIPA